MEEDAELYMEVSAKVEPAIKLSRGIIRELREDNEGLKYNIRELQGNNKKLHQELENACKKLIGREVRKGTDIEAAKKELMEIFMLTEKEADLRKGTIKALF